MRLLPEKLIGPLRAWLKKEHTDDAAFDQRYGIDTSGYLPISEHEDDSSQHTRVHDYHGTPVVVLQKLLRKVLAQDSSPEVFIDYGAGLGRCLFVALEEGIQEAIGIECCDAFLQQGQKNIETAALDDTKKRRLHMVNIDATDYSPPPQSSVFFLFNPFDEATTQAVADKIARSHVAAPAPRYLIYYNPWHRKVFDQHARFELIEEGTFSRIWKRYKYYPYCIYRLAS